MDSLEISRSEGLGNDDEVAAGDIDDDEDGEGEETGEDLIQELEELEEKSEPGFHPLVRALYHTVSCVSYWIGYWNCRLSKRRVYCKKNIMRQFLSRLVMYVSSLFTPYDFPFTPITRINSVAISGIVDLRRKSS